MLVLRVSIGGRPVLIKFVRYYYAVDKMGGFCCQVPPETPPYGANRKGFEVDHLTALSSEASLSIVVISNY